MNFDELQHAYLLSLHNRHNGNREAMSQESGIPLRTLFNRLRDYGWQNRGGPGPVPSRLKIAASVLESLVAMFRLAAPGEVKPVPHSAYGYCPKCGAMGNSRERRPGGNDTCRWGHVYPSSEAVPEKIPE